ncbi:M48 family metalloprotease [bacterium]|nr:M48 family metalloprotease [bacterium]
MRTFLKAGLVILVNYAFWVFIFWAICEAFGVGLIGAAIGFLIATSCILFAVYGLKYAIMKDLEATRVTGGAYADVNRIIADMAYKEGLPKPDVYAANVFAPHAMSIGTSMQSMSLFVTKGLVDKLNEDELKAYIMHELAHLKRGDHVAADIGAAVAYFLLFPTRIFDSINDGENVGKVLAMLIFGPFAAIFVQLGAYRAIDYEADKFAAQIHGQGYSLASALNTGQKDIRKHPIKVPLYCAHLFTVEPITTQTQSGALFITHVPTPKRMTRLKRLGKKIIKKAIYKKKGIT